MNLRSFTLQANCSSSGGNHLDSPHLFPIDRDRHRPLQADNQDFIPLIDRSREVVHRAHLGFHLPSFTPEDAANGRLMQLHLNCRRPDVLFPRRKQQDAAVAALVGGVLPFDPHLEVGEQLLRPDIAMGLPSADKHGLLLNLHHAPGLCRESLLLAGEEDPLTICHPTTGKQIDFGCGRCRRDDFGNRWRHRGGWCGVCCRRCRRNWLNRCGLSDDRS